MPTGIARVTGAEPRNFARIRCFRISPTSSWGAAVSVIPIECLRHLPRHGGSRHPRLDLPPSVFPFSGTFRYFSCALCHRSRARLDSSGFDRHRWLLHGRCRFALVLGHNLVRLIFDDHPRMMMLAPLGPDTAAIKKNQLALSQDHPFCTEATNSVTSAMLLDAAEMLCRHRVAA
jgi:hypothetical protein